MFVIKLERAIVYEGLPLALFGPFPTINAALAWGNANLPDDGPDGTIEPIWAAPVERMTPRNIDVIG